MITKKTVILSLIPFTIIGLYIFLFGLNIPFLDQWDVVPLLIKKQQGILSLADLFAQHNEHRPFFPRLIWITLSEFTNYNVNAELWVNLLIAAGTFVFVADRSIKMWARLEISPPPFLIPLMSLLVFNLGQRESWLQGFQTIMFLGTACVIIGVFMLAENSSWRNFLAAIVLGIIATYSMANGLLYWLIGLVIIFITTSKKMRFIRIALWLFLSGMSVGLFLTGWGSGGNLNLGYVFTHILEWSVWILNFLGAPIMTLSYAAWVFGSISVVLYILIIVGVIRTGQWRLLIPYFAIVFFILVTSLSISLGRMELGMNQSVVPRYLTMSVWYWVSLLALLPLLNIKRLYQRALYSMLAVSAAFLMIGGGWSGYKNIYQRIRPVYEAVTSGQVISDELLSRIYSDPVIARSRLDFLCKNNLSVCTDETP